MSPRDLIGVAWLNVIPAEAGIHLYNKGPLGLFLDPRLRGDDIVAVVLTLIYATPQSNMGLKVA